MAAVKPKLYVQPGSHPCAAVEAALRLKDIDFDRVDLLPLAQLLVGPLRYGGSTVPCMRIGSARLVGSRTIMRRLDELAPEPALLPATGDPARGAILEAERWGDEELQDFPRRLFRWGLVRHLYLRRWLSAESGIPAPSVAARLSGLNARYYARLAHADEAAVRRDLAELPKALDHADALLADGTLQVEPPNAAGLQVLCTVRALDCFSDLHPIVSKHPSAAAAERLFPDYPGPIPAFIPPEWLPAS